MNKKYATISLMLVLVSFVVPAHAVQLDVAIPKGSEEFSPVYTFTRIISIQYSEDSRLAELFGDVQQKILFDLDSENAAVLIEKINSQLAEKSFVIVDDVSGEYSATITPQVKSVSIEYKITIQPTMKGHFISDNVLDAQWRGFEILDKVPIETEYGIIDINSPMAAVSQIPELKQYLSDSEAMQVLELSILDASGLELSLSSWESMFDPTGKMSEAEEYGFSGTVITNYSMGICTVYRGVCQDRDISVSFERDGEEYSIRSIESQDDGTIVIDGYVQESSGRTESFLVTDDRPENRPPEEGQIPILYTASGAGIAIAAGFFVWSDKKSKKTSTEQTGIDPSDLSSVAIGSSAGSYQTNRGTAELR